MSVCKHLLCFKAAGVKVYPRPTWNFRSHAVSACISLWHHKTMYALTACIAPWHHRPMRAVTEWALLFWFNLGYTFTSSYFGFAWMFIYIYISMFCKHPVSLTLQLPTQPVLNMKSPEIQYIFIYLSVLLLHWYNYLLVYNHDLLIDLLKSIFFSSIIML